MPDPRVYRENPPGGRSTRRSPGHDPLPAWMLTIRPHSRASPADPLAPPRARIVRGTPAPDAFLAE